MDMPVINVHSVKLDLQLIEACALTLQPVLDNMLFNFQLIVSIVVDAKTVLGQEKSQINSNNNVFQDQLSHAVTVEQDNLPINTLANNAQQDKFNQLPMLKHATLQHVPDNIRLDLLLSLTSTVEHVKLANGHNTCQMLKEHNAS